MLIEKEIEFKNSMKEKTQFRVIRNFKSILFMIGEYVYYTQ